MKSISKEQLHQIIRVAHVNGAKAFKNCGNHYPGAPEAELNILKTISELEGMGIIKATYSGGGE